MVVPNDSCILVFTFLDRVTPILTLGLATWLALFLANGTLENVMQAEAR